MSGSDEASGHVPVLVGEVLERLAVRPGGIYVDGTLGSGGHARAVLERAGPQGVLLGIDRDAEAIARARRNLQGVAGRCVFVKGNFAEVAGIARREGFDRVDGVLLDIGVSSEQLDEPERGFSFRADSALDMRMDRSSGSTAADLIRRLSEEELRSILRDYGEEHRAARIARAIVAARKRMPLATTGELARVVETAAGGRRGRLHPATRTFQALRIAVNDELDCLERGLVGGLDLLAPGGRLAVISFHSLEDRIVKRFAVRHAGRWESLQAGGRRWHGELPVVALVTRKPVTPSEEEVGRNPRARSAKLRVVERLAGGPPGAGIGS